jgi:hypothetical protein
VARSRIDQETVRDRTVPGRHHRPVPGNPLKKAQGVLFEGDVKEELNVVQQHHLIPTSINDFTEQSVHLQRPLPLGQIKQATAKFQVYVDISEPGMLSFSYLLERCCLSRPSRSYNQDQPMVQLSRLIDPTNDLFR